MIRDNRGYADDIFLLKRRRVDNVQQGRMLAPEIQNHQRSK